MTAREQPADAPVRRGDTVAIPGDYQHRARTRGPVVQRFWHAEKERAVRKHNPPLPGERALDVGCGSGVVSSLLRTLGAETVGVDANPDAVEFARRTFGRQGLKFHVGLVGELDFEPCSFDRLYCLELVEHLYEHQSEALLRDLHSVGRDGATLMLTTPNYRGAWPVLEFTLDLLRLVPRLADEQHVARFHAAKLRALLERTGWEVRHLGTFCTVAPFASVLGWRMAERLAEAEDRWAPWFGNLLLAVAVKRCTG